MAAGHASIIAAALAILLLYRLSRVGRRPKGCPPGPPTLPFIGNLHLIPKQKGHLQFQKWADEYGPIYSLILGTQVTIVLSSDKVVKDLLDKRSRIYSSRPKMYLSQDIASGGFRVPLLEYGETWRMVRGIMHNTLNVHASKTYIPYQDLESKAMLLGFLEQPSRFFSHLHRFGNSLSTQIALGFRTPSIDDPKLIALTHATEEWSDITGSQTAALLNLYPILRYLPDALVPQKRHAREIGKKEYDLYVGHYLTAKRKLKDGKVKPCSCSDIAKAQEKFKFSDGLAAYISGALLEAGTDTSAATLIGFVQALLIFPEVAKLAQAEIDRVCGDRMPNLDDLPDLPYIRGCVKESLRWMPTAVLGIPHATIQDDEYMGYHIPKGATVVLNVWAINHDPARHPNPSRFDPSRWAHDNQTSAESARAQDPSKRDHFVFGAGRRVCQGMHIADRNLFLAISRLLWAFNFERPIDPRTGEQIVPPIGDLSEGLLIRPNPFPADIKPRSQAKVDVMKNEWSKMAELLDDQLQWKEIPEGIVWEGYGQGGTETDF